VVRRVRRSSGRVRCRQGRHRGRRRRLADLFGATYVGWWEWATRRNPVLTRLGLSPDQCGALLAGSRHYRHNGKRDSLLAAVRSATEHGVEVELMPAHRWRLAVYVDTDTTATQPPQVRLPQLANANHRVGPTGISRSAGQIWSPSAVTPDLTS